MKLALLLIVLLLVSCAPQERVIVKPIFVHDNQMSVEKAVKIGDQVKVEYVGKLVNGTVFDQSRTPLEFTVGDPGILPGFSQALLGLRLNQVKEFSLLPEQAYGAYNESLLVEIPRTELPPGDPQVGQTLIMTLSDGRQQAAIIAKINNETISLDTNHPLAGQTLAFMVKVVGIE